MISQEIVTQPKNRIDHEKIASDLSFIKSLQQLAQDNHWRIVVSGGYGLDILLGKITRNHGDVDVVLYGALDRVSATDIVLSRLETIAGTSDITTKDEQFFTGITVNSPDFGADIYFVETVDDPRVDVHRVRKLDGEVIINTEKRFPSPVLGRLGDLEIEVQNQNTHLADIVFKRRKQEHKNSHNQDMVNLKLITNKDTVETILSLTK